jgi:hypothetical protein
VNTVKDAQQPAAGRRQINLPLNKKNSSVALVAHAGRTTLEREAA